MQEGDVIWITGWGRAFLAGLASYLSCTALFVGLAAVKKVSARRGSYHVMGDMRSRRVVLLGLVEHGGVGRRLRSSLEAASKQCKSQGGVKRRRRAAGRSARLVSLVWLAGCNNKPAEPILPILPCAINQQGVWRVRAA
jgi:hypothetical protein